MPIATFAEAQGNAIDIFVRGTNVLSDADRAIVLNLLDFGQDYESARSTTIEAVIFYVDNPLVLSVESLLNALDAANFEAAVFMTERLAEFPPSDDYLETAWPQDWVENQKYDWPGYHFFYFELAYSRELTSAELEFARHFLDASHDVNMWNGYNPGQSAFASVSSGRNGLSFEVAAEGEAITYAVERTPCDPALSVKHFANVMYERIGIFPERWDIRLEPEG